MKRALLVIDVQNEYFTGRLPVVYPPNSFENILQAMDAAARAAIHVAVIRHTAIAADSTVFRKGSPEWELHPDVAGRRFDILIEKNLPGSFTNTNLGPWLGEKGVDTITVCGYMTQVCCDTTARQAFHRGLSVEFLSDATGTLAFQNSAGSVTAEELHRAILVTQAMRFSKVMKTSEWMEEVRKG